MFSFGAFVPILYILNMNATLKTLDFYFQVEIDMRCLYFTIEFYIPLQEKNTQD